MIHHFRWLVLFLWLSAGAALALLAPKTDPTLGEATDLLPQNTPVHIGLSALEKHFGEKSGLSSIVIVFERSAAPLTPDDLSKIESIARLIPIPLPQDTHPGELKELSIRTPATLAIAGKFNPLISDDGHAGLIWVSLPFNYITKQAARIVQHTQQIIADQTPTLPAGLTASVTGSAGYGYDYAVATDRSHQKTVVVTLISVVVILLLIYRAPIAAFMPLAAISLAAVVVFKLLAFAERFGLHSGMAEQIFTFVLLYGAGVDYSLLFLSRFREFLNDGQSSAQATQMALDASFGAIASSAAMTISGLAMFCFARFSIYRHAGPAVVLALFVAALAALTLVPALLAIIGTRVFWPAHHFKFRGEDPTESHPPSRKAWQAIARLVVLHPRWVMGLTLAALLLPALRGSWIDWNYDALYSLKPNYPARKGTEMVERHWPAGETAPVNVLAVADQPQSPVSWQRVCNAMTAKILAIPDVGNVRALTLPLGAHVDPAETAAIQLLAANPIAAEFLSPDQRSMRLSTILRVAPFTRAAMDDAPAIGQAAARAAADAGLHAQIHVTGSTAEMIDLREITQHDFHAIAMLSLGVMLVVVIVLLRDPLLAMFILAATALSYFTTLGLTYWMFGLLGSTGLEWKVQMLLFIVLVAVGQDYSIFFAVRLAQERRNLPLIQATQRALVFTGPVISACGLIMAATLGSVMAGDVRLLFQLGFAFALGMLIDTFIVRPLLLPAFILLRPTWLEPRAAIAAKFAH